VRCRKFVRSVMGMECNSAMSVKVVVFSLGRGSFGTPTRAHSVSEVV
jgi:hypothetical protein